MARIKSEILFRKTRGKKITTKDARVIAQLKERIEKLEKKLKFSTVVPYHQEWDASGYYSESDPDVELKKQVEHQKEVIAKLVAENRELQGIQKLDILDSTDQAQQSKESICDIASERWEAFDGCDNDIWIFNPSSCMRLVQSVSASWAQLKVMAAAPELAGLIRDDIAMYGNANEDHTYINPSVLHRIRRLRELGILNVAPWYKVEGQE